MHSLLDDRGHGGHECGGDVVVVHVDQDVADDRWAQLFRAEVGRWVGERTSHSEAPVCRIVVLSLAA